MSNLARSLKAHIQSGGVEQGPQITSTTGPGRLAQIDRGAHQELSRRCQGYLAADFPVQPVVTYVQGADDVATAASQMTRHFKKVPLGFAQFILIRGLGHSLESNRSMIVPDAIFSLPPAVVADILDGRDLAKSAAFQDWCERTPAAIYRNTGGDP